MEKEIALTDDEEKGRWYDGALYQSCLAVMPFVRWFIILAMAVAGYYVYQRDVNAAQTVDLRGVSSRVDNLQSQLNEAKNTNSEQINKIRAEMLTKEVFLVYMDQIKREQEYQRNLSEKILEAQRP